MRDKTNLALVWRRLYLMFRSIGWAFFVPVIVLNMLLPITQWSEYHKSGLSDELLRHIQQTTAIFVPFFSAWWVTLFLRNVMEVSGGEMLYLGRQKQLLRDLLLIFGVYLADISALYTVYMLAFREMRLEFIKILFPCVFLFSLVFFLGSRTKSISFALFLVFFYVLFDYLIAQSHPVFPLYSTPPNAAFTGRLLAQYLPLLALSGGLIWVTLRFPRKI